MRLGIAVAVLWFAVAACGCGITRPSSVVAETGYNCGETEANAVVAVSLMPNFSIANEYLVTYSMPKATAPPLQWHYKMGNFGKWTWNYVRLGIRIPLSGK